MSNIDNIITDIIEVNATYDFWIRDKDGNIKDDIICGDVIPFLKELKNYEIEMTQNEIKKMVDLWAEIYYPRNYGSEYYADNTYNHNANIDHDIDYRILEKDEEVWFAFMVHRCGDVRANYTDWAVCKFDYIQEIFELESTMQHKFFGEDKRYVADINIFDEKYNVYDTKNNRDVGCFYDIEITDVLKEIKERYYA